MRQGETPTLCPEGYRRCHRCKETKPIEQFARHKNKPLGRGYLCNECNRVIGHKWRTENPEKKKASDKRSHAKRTPEQKEAKKKYGREYARAWRARHPSGNAHLWENHRMTQAQYDKLHAAQEGRCAVCQTDKPTGRGKKLHVDHCHRTKQIRGLLCQRCNSAVGFLEYLQHNNLLPVAISYLSQMSY